MIRLGRENLPGILLGSLQPGCGLCRTRLTKDSGIVATATIFTTLPTRT